LSHTNPCQPKFTATINSELVNITVTSCIVTISAPPMDIKLILAVLTGVFVVATLFFGTKNGFYNTDDYHGNGSAH
jgi:hypothetical protein